METLKNNILKSEILSDNTIIIICAFIDIQLEYERQQIVDAFTAGQIDIENYHENPSFKGDTTILISKIERAEQYFNNTFKK